MGVFNFIDPILNTIFLPIIKLGPLIGVAALSLLIALIIVIIYKYTTNQELMKSLKTKIKDAQKEMKKHKGDQKKLMKIQKQTMDANMQYMMHSFRPTLFTFIPIIIIFGWMSAHLGYAPIMPGQEFTSTIVFDHENVGQVLLDAPEGITITSPNPLNATGNAAAFNMTGELGEYVLTFRAGNNAYTKKVIITEGTEYASVTKREKSFRDSVYSFNGDQYLPKGSDVQQIELSNEKLRPMNLFGWKIGWFGSYIIFSIVFSSILRKLLKVY